jgi:hypothetical protein
MLCVVVFFVTVSEGRVQVFIGVKVQWLGLSGLTPRCTSFYLGCNERITVVYGGLKRFFIPCTMLFTCTRVYQTLVCPAVRLPATADQTCGSIDLNC